MIKLLFVCHGNICRSPMAEFVMRDICTKKGIDAYIESAATSTEEIGNGVHYKTAAILNSIGIDCSKKHARRITHSDYEKFDLIFGMDSANIHNMVRYWGDPEHKIHLLTEFSSDGKRDISDPWYTGDFESAYKDIRECCEELSVYIKNLN